MARILLIEDDVPLRSALRELLTAHGHAVTEAANGRSALALQTTRVFDLLILDILMPEQDGLEVLLALGRRISGLKIIVMSGGGLGAAAIYLDLAIRFGAHRTLQKPFSSQLLLQAVDELHPSIKPDRSSTVQYPGGGG